MRHSHATTVPVSANPASKIVRDLIAEMVRDHHPVELSGWNVTEYADAVTVVAELPNGTPVSRHEYLDEHVGALS